MSQKSDCFSYRCIYDKKLHKGFCVGVVQNTLLYGKEVIRHCWVKEPPTPNKCNVEMQSQLTPEEATSLGVALTQVSVLGEAMLRNIAPTAKKEGEK